MIVLDEHLKGLGVDEAIRRWYRGRVCILTELRPGTVVKDEAVPVLLRTVPEPTFVTLNWSDFWRRVPPDRHFCLVCLALPTSRADEVSPLLRRLFRLTEFRARAGRMGKVARVSGDQVAYHRTDAPESFVLALPR
jgi:hypothetical protein